MLWGRLFFITIGLMIGIGYMNRHPGWETPAPVAVFFSGLKKTGTLRIIEVATAAPHEGVIHK